MARTEMAAHFVFTVVLSTCTAALTTAKDCQAWCSLNNQIWMMKCTWSHCIACPQCESEDMLESTESRCDWLWCASRNNDWVTKCKRKRCDMCSECYGYDLATVSTEKLRAMVVRRSTRSDARNTIATVPIEMTAATTTKSSSPMKSVTTMSVPTIPTTSLATTTITTTTSTINPKSKEQSCASKRDKLSAQQCGRIRTSGLCKDFVNQCESTCNGCVSASPCSYKRNELSLSQCQRISTSGLCKDFAKQCESTCNGCDASSSERSTVSVATSDGFIPVPTSPADSRPPSRSANVTSAIISVGHQTGPGRDDSEDTIGVKTVTITLQVGGVCFILIIIATVCVVFFHELRTKNNRLHSPNTDAQRTDNGSRAQHNRHSNSILPKRRQAEDTISIDRDPDAADPDAQYPGAHTADPGYDTGADCETESKTDDLLTFDKFGYDGVMVETDAENPIDSLAASVVEDNLSDMQTVVIKPDTPPSTAEDDDAASGFESYYAYSRASTYTTPIVR